MIWESNSLLEISYSISLFLSSVCLSVSQSVCLSIFLFVYLSLCVCVCLSIGLCVHLSVCLSFYLFVYLDFFFDLNSNSSLNFHHIYPALQADQKAICFMSLDDDIPTNSMLALRTLSSLSNVAKIKLK